MSLVVINISFIFLLKCDHLLIDHEIVQKFVCLTEVNFSHKIFVEKKIKFALVFILEITEKLDQSKVNLIIIKWGWIKI